MNETRDDDAAPFFRGLLFALPLSLLLWAVIIAVMVAVVLW